MQPGHANWMLDTSARVRFRTGRGWSGGWNGGSSARGGTSRRRLFEAMGRSARASSSRTSSRESVCRSLRRRVDWSFPWSGTLRAGTTPSKAVISPYCDALHRPEPGDGGRSAPFSRDRAGAGRVAGWPQTDLFQRGRSRAEYERCCADTGSILGSSARAGHREHADERALRGALRRAARLVVGEGRAGRLQLLFRPIRGTGVGGALRRTRGRAGRPPCRSPATPTSSRSRRSSSTRTPSSATRGRSCWTRSSATARPSASCTTRVRRPGVWAAKNVVGEHYQELATSGAFYRAERFDEVVAGIEHALRPGGARRGARAGRSSRSWAGRRTRGRTGRGRRAARGSDEARDDAACPRRGGHRGRADRVPPPCGRRLRDRDG